MQRKPCFLWEVRFFFVAVSGFFDFDTIVPNGFLLWSSRYAVPCVT